MKSESVQMHNAAAKGGGTKHNCICSIQLLLLFGSINTPTQVPHVSHGCFRIVIVVLHLFQFCRNVRNVLCDSIYFVVE